MRRALAGLGVLVGLLLGGAQVSARDAGVELARRAQVVARLGTLSFSVGDVEDRIAALPPFQRATFGATPSAIARNFITEIMVPEALLELRAEAMGLAVQPPNSYAIERARSKSTVRAIRARLGDASAIPMDEVSAYYDQNRERFSSPVRFLIWRILCKTREEAQTVLDACKVTPTPASFSALARDHSMDKGSYLRGGNLGFVADDGSTAEPGLRVDLAVVRAVSKVRDGDLVPAPVPEGDYFAVAWRRGTRPGFVRTATEAAPQIRDTLRKLRIKDETDKLVARLRADRLRGLDETPLETADIDTTPR
jgi:peptidyl-prolyl cis-trans isomerase C